MHIVYCIHGTYNSGGMERVLANKANFLIKHGYKITIITTDQQGRDTYFPLDPRIQQLDLGINYTLTPKNNIISTTITHLKKTRHHKKLLSKLLSSLHADITVSMFCNEVNFLYKIKDGSKKIVEIHFSKNFRKWYKRKMLWCLADKYRDWRESKLVKHYARFIVLTQQDRLTWGNLKNICVIHNAILTETTKQTLLTNKIVLAVGRLSFQKGHDILLEAWKQVTTVFPDWKLRIVGEGEEKQHLQQLVKINHMEATVEMPGATQNIEQEYTNSSIFVMSSRYEGLPMVLLEAASYGLPLVSFDCPCGPAEVIKNGTNGILVSNGNVKELAHALITLIESPDKRISMGHHARKSLVDFSEESVMQKWTALFEQVNNKNI